MAQEPKKPGLKRPNIWVIKTILESVERGEGLSTFSDMLEFDEATKNRKDLGLYLRLLLSLGWIEPSKGEAGEVSSYPGRHYAITNRGRLFVSLFPAKTER